MNLTGSSIYNSAVDNEDITFETNLYKTLMICGSVLGFNLIIYCSFYFFKKIKSIKYFLKLAINYTRPIIGGFILGLSVLKRNRKSGDVKSFTGLIYYCMNIFPAIQFLLLLIFMTVWISFKFSKTAPNLGHRQYHAVCYDEENGLDDNDENDINLRSLGCLERIQLSINQILPRKLYKEFKLFNNVFAPKLILCFLFLHSFYAGLGFDAFKTIEFFEIIIIVHKFFEVYLIIQAFEKIKPNKYVEVAFTIVYFFMTPLGIFLRNYMEIRGTSFYNVSSNVLCNNIFYRSLLITTTFENLMPLPESAQEIILNFISFVMVSVITGFLLMKFFPSY